MRTICFRTILAVVLVCLLYAVAIAGENATSSAPVELPPAPVHDPELDAALDSMVRDTLAQGTAGLTEDRVHIALIDLGSPKEPRSAHFRGDVPVYPASVVKMFYMGYVYHLVERGELELTPELRNLLTQMIRPSSNVATGKIVDRWSGTQKDTVLPPDEFEDFAARRNACNRWLQGVLNIEDVNANQKTWGGTIPDAERQFLSGGEFGGPWVNRNSMTAMAAARYLQLLAQDRLASPESCNAMRTLMKRDVNEQPYQKRRIAGGAPQGAEVYSKTGTTSDTFHDAGIVKLPNGRTFVLTTLITGTGSKGNFIPELTRRVSDHFMSAAE